MSHHEEKETLSQKKQPRNVLTEIQLKHQINARSTNQSKYLESIYRNTFTFGVGLAGTGKCHKKGTLIRMYDGSIKRVEDIQNGEYVMGDDSTPRLVYGTTSGREEMFEIIPIKGKPFTVNRSHILCLKNSHRENINQNHPEYVNISVDEYLKQSSQWQRYYKLYRVAVNYGRYPVKIDPYFMGLWLGDGNWSEPVVTNIDQEIIDYVRQYAEQLGMMVSVKQPRERCQFIRIKNRTSKNTNPLKEDFKSYGLMLSRAKFIPREYLVNDKQTRLELLAGLIDSDGSLSCNGFEIASLYPQLALDIQELALSLGFWASINPKKVDDTTYHRVFISGCTDEIPTRLSRKQASPRKQIKDVKNTGFTITPVGIGEYYGFAVDGNHKYLLDDFIVTHNTLLATYAAVQYLLDPKNRMYRIVVIRPMIGNKFGESIGALPGTIAEKMIPYGSSVIDNLKMFMDPADVNKLVESGYIEFVPLTLLRGRSLNNAFVIVEEAQNIKESGKGVYMVMSRLGKDSKMVFNGDLRQSDLADDDSALAKALEILTKPTLPRGVGIVELYDREDVQRHPLLYEIMERFGEVDDNPF